MKRMRSKPNIKESNNNKTYLEIEFMIIAHIWSVLNSLFRIIYEFDLRLYKGVCCSDKKNVYIPK